MPDLNALLWPKTIAVLGASPDATIIRGRIIKILASRPFPGTIYPISRSHDEVLGLKAYKAVGDIPEKIDLAVFVIPAANVTDALEECGAAGVKAALIISSGFAEEVSETGPAQQKLLQDIARRYDMAVIGPNSEGFTNALLPFAATFSPAMDDPDTPLIPDYRTSGFVGVTGQSGGIGYSFFDRGRPKEIPFSYVITTGNEACLSGLDFVDYMLEEGRTDVFALFMEDIKDPAKLPVVAEKALRAGKPIVLTKVGRSAAGVRAAASHTGALAGSYTAYEAMFEKYGIIQANDIEELVDITMGFSHWGHRLPKGNRVGIVTGSGGGGGWMADCCAAAGLEVPELDAKTRATIDQYLPAYGTSQNPVDGTAGAIRQVGYSTFAEMVAGSSAVDSVVVVTSARNPAGFVHEKETFYRVAKESDKPIVFCSYTLPRGASVEFVNKAGFPLFINKRNCARTIAEMAKYRAFREEFLKVPSITTDKTEAPTDVGNGLTAARGPLCEYEAKPMLAAYGIPVTEDHLVNSAGEAAEAARKIGGPVVLKVQSPDILHKTEAGAVALGIQTPEAAKAAYADLLEKAQAYKADADIRGVLVQPMAPKGQEIILGVHRDDAFGPIMMVGLGGVYVEVMKDVAFAPAPLTEAEAQRALRRLKGFKLLEGVRGEPAADVDALIDVMVKLSRFAADWSDKILEIDLNPVLVHPKGQGVSIVDALIVPETA
jgi:acyl-CoA synthetase (NDP forming)